MRPVRCAPNGNAYGLVPAAISLLRGPRRAGPSRVTWPRPAVGIASTLPMTRADRSIWKTQSRTSHWRYECFVTMTRGDTSAPESLTQSPWQRSDGSAKQTVPSFFAHVLLMACPQVRVLFKGNYIHKCQSMLPPFTGIRSVLFRLADHGKPREGCQQHANRLRAFGRRLSPATATTVPAAAFSSVRIHFAASAKRLRPTQKRWQGRVARTPCPKTQKNSFSAI